MIPKTEIRWVSHLNKEGKLCYITTSKPDRSIYYLYDVKDGESQANKIAKGSNPVDFDKFIKL